MKIKGDQLLSPPGYNAPDKKAGRCRNERQEGLAGGKRSKGKGEKIEL